MEKLKEKLEEIRDELTALLEKEGSKLEKNNVSSAKRVRKAAVGAMKDLKNLRSELMKEIHEIRETRSEKRGN